MLRLLRQVGQYLNSCSYTNFDIIFRKIWNILASFTYAEAPTPGWTIFHQLLPAAERPTIQQIVNEGKGHHDRCYEEVSDRQRHDEEVADLPEVAVRVDG